MTHRKRCLQSLLIAGFSACHMMALAHNLGVYGRVYPIEEMSFLTLIEHRLSALASSGKLRSLQKKMQAQAKRRADRPVPVAGLSVTQRRKSYSYDPTIEVPYDISDHHNRLVVAAGTRVNPLTRVELSSALLFFDGDDPKQVDWARQQATRDQAVLLILTAGSIKQQVKHFQRKVFFDQHGALTQKLGIHHVPAIVTQDGDRLRIVEEKP